MDLETVKSKLDYIRYFEILEILQEDNDKLYLLMRNGLVDSSYKEPYYICIYTPYKFDIYGRRVNAISLFSFIINIPDAKKEVISRVNKLIALSNLL